MTAIKFPTLGNSRPELAARVLAAVVVFLDARLVPDWSRSVGYFFDLQALAPTAVIASLLLSNGNAAAHGLLPRPHQGWRPWVLFALFAAAVIFVLCVIGAVTYWIMGWSIPIPKRDLRFWAEDLNFMCVIAPIHEELVYRVLFTVAVLPLLGFYGTVIAGGVLFGLIHVLGGNPGPDNLIAGFFLQWAYMKSGTVLVPLAMHSSGNLIAFSAQVLSTILLPGAM